MAKKKNDFLNSPFIIKSLDILQTLIAHPLVGVGMFALATYPIEDWWRQTHKEDSLIKNPIALLREGILVMAAADAALGSMIPAVKGMGHAALSAGKPSVGGGGVSFFLE